MTKDMERHVQRCHVCQEGNGTTTNANLYLPLQVPTIPWMCISVDFVLGPPPKGRMTQSWWWLIDFLRWLILFLVGRPWIPQMLQVTWINYFFCLVGENNRSWESILPLAEFAYNSSLNQTINTSSFRVVYGSKPSVIYLASLPLCTKTNMADLMKNVLVK